MVGILPPRIWTQQPNHAVPIVWPDGITPIAAYNAANGFVDCSGAAMTRGSAANIGAGKSGLSIKQTAVNTSVYRPIVGLPSVLASYMAVWSGDFVGAPTGGTAKICGISNTASSQSGDLLGIERGSTADHIQLVGKSGGTGILRDINVGASAWYGKRVTLVFVNSIQDVTFRLLACVDGAVTEYSSTYTGLNAPNILGTERLVIGADIIENASRFANVNAAFAAFACGSITTNYARSVAANPWQIFAPMRRNVFSALSGGGSTGIYVSNSSQANTAESVAIQQTHKASIANSSQANATAPVSVKQTHAFYVANSTQQNSASSASVLQTDSVSVAIGNSAQSNSASSATILQTHKIISSPSFADNIASASSVAQTHLINALNSQILNACSSALVRPPGYFSEEQLQEILAYIQENLMVPTAEQIAAAVIAAMVANPPPVDLQKVNGYQIDGDGSATTWGPA